MLLISTVRRIPERFASSTQGIPGVERWITSHPSVGKGWILTGMGIRYNQVATGRLKNCLMYQFVSAKETSVTV